MKRLRVWTARIAGFLGATRRDADLADEIESHLQLHTDENIARGMPPEEARRTAALKLGSVITLTEEYRERRGLPVLERLLQDLRYAGRTARRSPGITIVAAITLALGVAGPTVMFAMMKAWILDPLPFAQPDGLADIRMLDTATGRARAVNPADFLDWASRVRSFERLAAYRDQEFRLTGGDRPTRVHGARVTLDFFHVLRVQPALGRVFGSGERPRRDDRVVVLSEGLWRERFGRDPSILGRSINLDAEPYTVVGVLPESFHFTLLGRVELWAPSCSHRVRPPIVSSARFSRSAGCETVRCWPRAVPSSRRSPASSRGVTRIPTPGAACESGVSPTKSDGITTRDSWCPCSLR